MFLVEYVLWCGGEYTERSKTISDTDQGAVLQCRAAGDLEISRNQSFTSLSDLKDYQH